MHITFSLTQAVMSWLKVQNELWRTKENRSEHGGRERNKIKKAERQTQPTQWERQTGRGRGKTGRKENSKRDLAFLTWGAGKERKREARKKEGGMGEGREGRRRGRWQERKFNLAPDSISIPNSQPHRHSHKISTLCKWHRSPFGDFPSSEIRLDICPPPPLPGSSTEADSQIKIARGTIQTLLPFCRECLLTALDLRG